MRSYAESCFLPFNLRLLKTFLPFAVLILFLKPCSFFLCLFLGWYVLNINYTPIPYQVILYNPNNNNFSRYIKFNHILLNLISTYISVFKIKRNEHILFKTSNQLYIKTIICVKKLFMWINKKY